MEALKLRSFMIPEQTIVIIYTLHELYCVVGHKQESSLWKFTDVSEEYFAGSLLCLIVDPEYGGDMFLRNVGWLSTVYTTLYLRR
jgi:hypothetical protein